MLMDIKTKQFLNLLGDNYYIFGGKALSKILKGVESYDWDIIIDSNYENINTIRQKLQTIFGNGINCVKQSFIRSAVGTSHVLYGCTYKNNGDVNDIIDVKFEPINNHIPRVILNDIIYLDIKGLYKNLIESIQDSYYLLDEYEEYYQRTSDRFIKKHINNELVEYEELLDLAIEDDDQEEIDEYNEKIESLQSKEYYQEVLEELTNNLSEKEDSRKKAISLIRKNIFRLIKLKQGLQNPKNFKPDYIRNLCNECYVNDLQIVRNINNIKLYCDQLQC